MHLVIYTYRVAHKIMDNFTSLPRTCSLLGISYTHAHTHLYVQTIHCGESALWGKSVRLSWRRGENFVSPQCKFISPQCNVLMCVTLYSERRILIAIPAYRYTDQSHTCSRITHAHTIYRPCM